MSNFNMKVLALSYYIVSFGYSLLEVCSFLMRVRKGVDLEGRWGKSGGRENTSLGIIHEKRV